MQPLIIGSNGWLGTSNSQARAPDCQPYGFDMDYLVNLSLVKPVPALDARMEKAGVTIRRALAPELELVTGWVREKFGSGWASETTVALPKQPPPCFLANPAQKINRFSGHE